LLPLTCKLIPPLGDAWLVRLFLKPVRHPLTKSQIAGLSKFEVSDHQVKGYQLRLYKRGTGPEVICMHGWSGKALQFLDISEALDKAGYTFIGIDAPGHGKSSGGLTNMFEFTDAFEFALSQAKQPKAVIGHSLGAACIAFSAARETSIPALVTVGAPVLADDILSEFTRMVNAPKGKEEAIRQATIKRFGVTFDSVTLQTTFNAVKAPVLGIHGKEDMDVPHTHLDVLKSMKPDMTIQKFEGVGHRRILKEPEAISSILDWIRGL